MKPTDLRNLTWAQVQEHIGDDLRRVHEAWAEYGPGTTRQIAEKSGISLLTFRPRTTDLYHIGLVECTGCEDNAGVYRFVCEADAAARQKWKQVPGKARAESPELRANSTAAREAALPTRSEISHAASVLARARSTRRAKPAGAHLFQPELFSQPVSA